MSQFLTLEPFFFDTDTGELRAGCDHPLPFRWALTQIQQRPLVPPKWWARRRYPACQTPRASRREEAFPTCFNCSMHRTSVWQERGKGIIVGAEAGASENASNKIWSRKWCGSRRKLRRAKLTTRLRPLTKRRLLPSHRPQISAPHACALALSPERSALS